MDRVGSSMIFFSTIVHSKSAYNFSSLHMLLNSWKFMIFIEQISLCDDWFCFERLGSISILARQAKIG